MKHSYYKLVLTFLLLSLAFTSWSQTNTWNGSTDNLWSDATNWSLNLVPTAAHDVVINIATNYPNVDINASCKSLTLNASTSLIVNVGFTLTSSGSDVGTPGITNNGNITNNGSIIVSNTGFYGISNTGSAGFINNGTLTVSTTAFRGISCILNSTFTNNGTINLSNVIVGSPRYGMYIESTFINSTLATTNISNIDGIAMYNSSTLTPPTYNDGTMNFDNVVIGIQIMNTGAFTNDTNGEIYMTNLKNLGLTISYGIDIISTNSVFDNNGSIDISSSPLGSGGIHLIVNSFFNNNATGSININGLSSTSRGVYNQYSTFNNYGAITINDCNSGIDNLHNFPVLSTFNNFVGATIDITNCIAFGVIVNLSNFYNYGSISTTDSSTGLYISDGGTFENTSGSSILINDANTGIILLAGSNNTMTNSGTIEIGGNISGDAMTIGGTPNSFINNADGLIHSIGLINNTNTFDTNGTLQPGFEIGEIIINSFVDLTATSIYLAEIEGGNGAGVAGGNDKLTFTNSTPTTISGTLTVTLINGYSPSVCDVFCLVTCDGGCNGTFDTVNLPSIPAGASWNLQYNANEIILEYNDPNPPPAGFVK